MATTPEPDRQLQRDGQQGRQGRQPGQGQGRSPGQQKGWGQQQPGNGVELHHHRTSRQGLRHITIEAKQPVFGPAFPERGQVSVHAQGQPVEPQQIAQPEALAFDRPSQGEILHHLAGHGSVATNGSVGLAAEQQKRTRRKGQGIAGIISALNWKTQSQQAGDDRLHQPLGQAATGEPRRQGEQIGPVGNGVCQGGPQRSRSDAHIRIDEDQPIAFELAAGAKTGPVFTHPALCRGTGTRRQQAKAWIACARLQG